MYCNLGIIVQLQYNDKLVISQGNFLGVLVQVIGVFFFFEGFVVSLVFYRFFKVFELVDWFIKNF